MSLYKYYRGNVDTGDTFRPEQSFLAPTDSTDQIVLTVVAHEIDGAGKLSKLVDREYQHWADVTQEMGGLALPPGNEGHAISKGTAILNFGLAWLGDETQDDLIAVDRLYASKNPMADVINGGTLPEREDFRPIDNRRVTVSTEYDLREGGLVAIRHYDSSDANSRYTFRFGFRLS